MASSDQEKHVSALSVGLSGLKRNIELQVASQKKMAMNIALTGIEIGRLICQFAETPEVQAAVDEINREKQARGEGGRERADHCFVAEQLCASGIEISRHWLEQCARAFKKLEAKGAKINTPVRELLKKESAGGNEIQKPTPNPDAAARDVIHRLEVLERITECTFTHAESFWKPICEKVSAWFAARGIRAEFHFDEKE